MTIARRSHLFPSRTQKLSSLAPMILGGKLPGKVGRCRFLLFFEIMLINEPARYMTLLVSFFWEKKMGVICYFKAIMIMNSARAMIDVISEANMASHRITRHDWFNFRSKHGTWPIYAPWLMLFQKQTWRFTEPCAIIHAILTLETGSELQESC